MTTLLTPEQTTAFRSKYGFPADVTFETMAEPTEGERANYGRSHWPPGPWHAEPFDKVVWTDPTTGLSCMLIRGGMGAWCGYAGIDPTHPWYGVGYSECTKGHKTLTQKEELHRYRRARECATSGRMRKMYDSLIGMVQRWYHPRAKCGYGHSPESILNAHGGITYSDYCAGNICHPHDEGMPKTFWYGWDSAHSGDLVPGMLIGKMSWYNAYHDKERTDGLYGGDSGRRGVDQSLKTLQHEELGRVQPPAITDSNINDGSELNQLAPQAVEIGLGERYLPSEPSRTQDMLWLEIDRRGSGNFVKVTSPLPPGEEKASRTWFAVSVYSTHSLAQENFSMGYPVLGNAEGNVVTKLPWTVDTYKGVAYCKAEVESLAQQLKEHANA